jgi:hypothetical protein
VYKLSIGAACALEWPPERFVIQVLDDSTDPVVKVRRRPDLVPSLTHSLSFSRPGTTTTFLRRPSWPGHSEQTNQSFICIQWAREYTRLRAPMCLHVCNKD